MYLKISTDDKNLIGMNSHVEELLSYLGCTVVFGEDIIVRSLLIPSLIDLVKLKASVVVHRRDCVKIVM